MDANLHIVYKAREKKQHPRESSTVHCMIFCHAAILKIIKCKAQYFTIRIIAYHKIRIVKFCLRKKQKIKSVHKGKIVGCTSWQIYDTFCGTKQEFGGGKTAGVCSFC